MERLPQGWVAGGMIQSTPKAAIRGYSASASPAWKSRITSRAPCPAPQPGGTR